MHEVGMTSRRLAGGWDAGRTRCDKSTFLCMLQKANGFCFREARAMKGDTDTDTAHTLPRVVSLCDSPPPPISSISLPLSFSATAEQHVN